MLLPAAGVNVTRPADLAERETASRRAGHARHGTFRVTFTVAVPPAGTVTDGVLSPSECAVNAAAFGLRDR